VKGILLTETTGAFYIVRAHDWMTTSPTRYPMGPSDP